jgi:hypothetical protein
MQNTPRVNVVRVLMYGCKNLKPPGIHVRPIQSIRPVISSGLFGASGLSFRQACSEHSACHIVRPVQSIRPVMSPGLLRASDLSFRQACSEHSACHVARPTQSIRPVISSGLLRAFGLSYRQAYSEHSAVHIVRPTQSIPRHPYSERLVTAAHPAVNCTHTFKSEVHVNFTGP